MAYVFDDLKNAMEEKANIFGGASGGGINTSAPVKTEIAGGGFGSPGAGVSSFGGTAGGSNQRNSNATQRILSTAGNLKAPEAFGEMKASMQGAQAAAQAEADTYGQKAADTSYDLKDSTISKAAKGNEKAGTAVAGLLSSTTPTAEAFVPTVDTDVVQHRYVDTPEGMGNLLQDQGGAQYSSGEKAFDNMLYGDNSKVQVNRENLRRAQDTLNQWGDALPGQETAKAQETLQTNHDSAVDKAKSALHGISDATIASVRGREAAEEAARKGTDVNAEVNSLAAKAIATLQKKIAKGHLTPEQLKDAQRIIAQISVDPMKFAKIGPKDVKWHGLINAKEAAELNRIGGFLGDDSSWQAGSGAGDYINFDAGGFSSAVGKGYTKQFDTKQAGYKSEIENIIADLTGKVGLENAGRTNDMSPAELNKLAAAAQAEVAKARGYKFPVSGDYPDARKYVSAGEDLTWDDLLDQAGATQLNTLGRKTGATKDLYKAGHAPDQYNWDETGYQKALIDFMQNLGATDPNKAALPPVGATPKMDDTTVSPGARDVIDHFKENGGVAPPRETTKNVPLTPEAAPIQSAPGSNDFTNPGPSNDAFWGGVLNDQKPLVPTGGTAPPVSALGGSQPLNQGSLAINPGEQLMPELPENIWSQFFNPSFSFGF